MDRKLTRIVGVADLSANGDWFDDLAQSLGAQHTFFAPDIKDRTRQVINMVQTSPSPVTIIGHGLGTLIALHAASLNPSSVQQLVLLDGPPKLTDNFDCYTEAVRIDPGVARTRDLYAHRDEAIAAGIANGRLPSQGMTRNLRAAIAREIVGSGFAWRSALTEGDIIKTLSEIAALGHRPELGVPTTVFRATHGHRRDELPLPMVDLAVEPTYVDCTHSGMLWDENALRTIKNAIRP